MKNVLVTGSIAYDHLMSFDGYFKDSLIADKLENLSLSLFADGHEVFFGGCAANIAYSLKLLGLNPIILGVAGNDFGRYADWLESKGIGVENIHIVDDSPTASASILTDKAQNQLTIFSPGAMQDHEIELNLTGDLSFDLAIISPEIPARMAYFGKYFQKLAVPYIFDPGQSLPAISGADLKGLVSGAVGLICNEYEAEMLSKKVGRSLAELSGSLKFAVKTCGERGCELFVDGVMSVIDAVENVEVVDSTGCGDAFRAGFICDFLNGENLKKCCESGNSLAAVALACRGTQNHIG